MTESNIILLSVSTLFFMAWALTFIVLLRQNLKKDNQIRQLTEVLLHRLRPAPAKAPEENQTSGTYSHVRDMLNKYNLGSLGPKRPGTAEAQQGKPKPKNENVKPVAINYGTS